MRMGLSLMNASKTVGVLNASPPGGRRAGPVPARRVGLGGRLGLGRESTLDLALQEPLAADRGDELADPTDQRERSDQGEQNECAVARLREHHDPEQDRDEAREEQQSAIAAAERQPKRAAGT